MIAQVSKKTKVGEGSVTPPNMNKDGIGEAISPTVKKEEEVSSIVILHQDGAKERRGSSTSSEAIHGSGKKGRDLANITDFCRYAMVIYDFHLTNPLDCKLEIVID